MIQSIFSHAAPPSGTRAARVPGAPDTAATPPTRGDDVTLQAASVLFGPRMQKRWETDLGRRVCSAVPSLDGQGVVVETTQADASRQQSRVDADGRAEALPPRPAVEGSRQSRSATLADGSEVLYSWDTTVNGPLSFDFDAIRLTRVRGDEVVWTQDLGVMYYQGSDAPISWPPVAMPNGGFLVARNGVECHDAQGALQWNCPGEAYGNFSTVPSVAADGTTYIVQNYMNGGMYGSMASRVHGYRPDGSHWQKSVGLVHCPPAVTSDGGAVMIYGTPSGTRLEKVSAEGRTEWQRSLEGRYGAVVEDAEGRFLLSRADEPSLIRYDAQRDERVWESPLKSTPVGLPVRVASGDVLLATQDGRVYGFADNLATDRPVVGPTPTIDASQQDWVVIGGVRVPRRH